MDAVCVYTASRDLFLMARPVASFPQKSLLLQSCLSLWTVTGCLGGPSLLTPSSFLAVDSCLLTSSVPLFLFPYLLVGLPVGLSSRVAGTAAHPEIPGWSAGGNWPGCESGFQ